MTDSLLTDTVGEIFAAVCTDDALRAAERDGFAPPPGRPWPRPGCRGSRCQRRPAARAATSPTPSRCSGWPAYHGLPLPLAETGVLAGWLLAGVGPAGLPRAHDGRVGPRPGVERGDGTRRRPGWSPGEVGRAGGGARVRTRALPADVVAVFAVADLRVEQHVNVAGEPRDTLYFDGAAPLASAPAGPGVSAQTLRRRGALTRIVLMAGAADRIRDITVRYTGERHQFGKPIGRFPGVQQHVVNVAQQAAMLEMAADLAVRRRGRRPGLAGQAAAFQVAAAKSVAADAATIATAAAHQAHGAMGMTQEYPLHFLTRRLWAWTREYGTGTQSADELGAIVAAAGADALWPAIASGGATLTRP